MFFRHLTIAFFAFLLPFVAKAQSSCDSLCVADKATQFHSCQLLFPAAAVSLGSAGIGNHLIDARGEREKLTFDDQLQYLPLAGYVGLGFIPGVKHQRNFGQRLMAGATAFVLMTAIVQGTKRIVSEPRPDTGATNSFPSGHTATSFAGAELVRLEYGWGYGAAAYAVAIGVGGMRVYNQRHWTNDVLAGAGIGVLSAEAAYWLLPFEQHLLRRCFKNNQKNSTAASGTSTGKASVLDTMVFAPAFSAEMKAPGFTFAMTF